MGDNQEAEDLRRMLDDNIEGVLDAIAGGWVRKGSTGYLTPKNPKNLGSFTVSLDDRGRMPRGSWHRFSQAIGGGSVELVAYQLYGRKDAYKEAFDWTRRHFGIDRREESKESKADRESRAEAEKVDRDRKQAERAKKDDADKAKRTMSAVQIWDECLPLAGTHGEAYLVARGLPAIAEWPWDCKDVLRFHPGLESQPEWQAGKFPAVIGNVQDAFGETVAIWQVFLDREKPAKAPLDNPKIGRGPASGGAVRIGGDGAHIGVGEGFETSLGAWALERFRYPVWATLSTSGMTSFEPPMSVERITIWPDGDWAVLSATGEIMDPPGIKAARALQARMKPAGIKCSINETTQDGDALDMYVAMKRIEARRGREGTDQ